MSWWRARWDLTPKGGTISLNHHLNHQLIKNWKKSQRHAFLSQKWAEPNLNPNACLRVLEFSSVFPQFLLPQWCSHYLIKKELFIYVLICRAIRQCTALCLLVNYWVLDKLLARVNRKWRKLTILWVINPFNKGRGVLSIRELGGWKRNRAMLHEMQRKYCCCKWFVEDPML